MSKKTLFIQGNETCAEAALYAGLDFYAGYPITPSTEIAELLSSRLPQKGGKFIQMEDEIASMCAIVGASLTGLKSMTATSGPGFSLKQEAIGYAVMAEVAARIAKMAEKTSTQAVFTAIPTKELAFARKIEREGIEQEKMYETLVKSEFKWITRLREDIAENPNSLFVDVAAPLQEAIMSADADTLHYPKNSDGHPRRAGYQVIADSLKSTVIEILDADAP